MKRLGGWMKSRAFSVFSGMVPLVPVLSLALAACAPSPPKGSIAIGTKNISHNPPDCACTLEYRMNLCATVNGSDVIPDSLSFLRERRSGAVDSLHTGARCFGEWRGEQRLLMTRATVGGHAVIDSSSWFTIRTVDCCHGEAKTVDFRK
jgi:hypothetical protein